MINRTNHQRGDTIVEVLIAMAVVSLVLGGAYASANRSLIETQVSQERAEGTKIMQGQMEALNAKSSIAPYEIFDSTTPVFCIDNSLIKLTPFGAYDPSTVSVSNTNFAKYTSGPISCRMGTDNRYYTSISYTPVNGLSRDTFNVIVRWDRLGGGYEEINANYRVHKQQ